MSGVEAWGALTRLPLGVQMESITAPATLSWWRSRLPVRALTGSEAVRYGRGLLDALPPATRAIGRWESLADRIRDFYAMRPVRENDSDGWVGAD